MRQVSILLGTAMVLLLSACAAVEQPLPPKVRLANVQFLDSTLFEQRMHVDLQVRNPNNFDLPLEGLTFELEVNGNRLAEGYSNEIVTIPRLGEAMVPVRASTSLLDMIQQFMALGQGGSLSYRLKGRAYLTGFFGAGVPFETSGKLELGPDAGRGQNLVPL